MWIEVGFFFVGKKYEKNLRLFLDASVYVWLNIGKRKREVVLHFPDSLTRSPITQFLMYVQPFYYAVWIQRVRRRRQGELYAYFLANRLDFGAEIKYPPHALHYLIIIIILLLFRTRNGSGGGPSDNGGKIINFCLFGLLIYIQIHRNPVELFKSPGIR